MARIPRTAEQERPAEWLEALQDDGGYEWLVADSGSLAVAAHRLAQAIGRTRSLPMALPTTRELESAARLLGETIGVPVPSTRGLLESCELAGLVVIQSIDRPLTPRRVRYSVDADSADYGY
ncbi:MAG TPA: hypothetical protein VHU80_04900 [Polyangiaceae bacterium]|jgi:hypothetical protein|nr:hypothetical protein [Polyangiaceae bacterium]